MTLERENYQLVTHSVDGTQVSKCPWCGTHTDSQKVIEFRPETVPDYLAFSVCQCTLCTYPIIYDHRDGTTIPYGSEFDDIPNISDGDLKQMYKEVRDAYFVGAYTCSVISCRTLLSHIAVANGADGNQNFTTYVQYIEKECLPPRMEKGWLDDVRRSGNECTHDLIIADKKLAKSMIRLAEIVLKMMYDIPKSDSTT